MSARRFVLERKEDIHGNSGTGTVAEGCEFENGWVALTWASQYSSGTWFPSIHNLKHLHGHEGRTRVLWIDPPDKNDIEEVKENLKKDNKETNNS